MSPNPLDSRPGRLKALLLDVALKVRANEKITPGEIEDAKEIISDVSEGLVKAFDILMGR